MNFWKKGWSLLLLVTITTFAQAQKNQEYIFQVDDSVLKGSYYEQTMEKKRDLLAEAGKTYTADFKKIYDDQFKEIEELFRTSRSVTSPEAHQYLQSVLRSILSANPVLRNAKLRAVFTRDWWPNAFSMGDGTIAINAGLMIYLENEAELAFVLSHELAHFYLDHSGKSIREYVSKINSEEFQDNLKRLSKKQYRVNQEVEQLVKGLAFGSHQHSRNNEAEADRYAFSFMKNAGYNCNEIKNCLGVLDRIDDTLSSKRLNVEEALNFTEYPFKKKWVEKETGIFSKMTEESSGLTKEEKDSLKTHPDCAKRIILLKDSLDGYQAPARVAEVDGHLFTKLKKEFFYEIIEQCFKEGNLARNLYYSLLLLQNQENQPYAVYSVARCLNDMYESRIKHDFGILVDIEKKGYPADYNTLLRVLNRLRLEEIAAINYSFCKLHYGEMTGYTAFYQEMAKIKKN